MAHIELKNIRKTFDNHPVIHGINLTVEAGEFLVFVGPSGCGKTTVLRMLAGLEDITAGELLFDGQYMNTVAAADRGAAMVFQNYALYPHMTVAENMGFALRMSGRNKAERSASVAEVAEKLQLTALLNRYPKQLSGGQRQRVAIGRAIVRRPKVFLFDEPLSNLDAALRVQMRIELAKLHAELGVTMIYVTHDQTEAMTLGDRIVVFNHGRIEQVGRPIDLYRAPANRFVAEFLGSPKINMLPYEWSQGKAKLTIASHPLVPVDSFLAEHQSSLNQGTYLGIRPEFIDVQPDGDGSGIPSVVEFVENLGDVVVIYARVEGLEELLRVKVSQRDSVYGDSIPRIDQKVMLVPQVAKLLVFHADGRHIT